MSEPADLPEPRVMLPLDIAQYHLTRLVLAEVDGMLAKLEEFGFERPPDDDATALLRAQVSGYEAAQRLDGSDPRGE